MATLVLSTVGSALGGPVGGAIGALIGQSFDRQLLAAASRGPRIGDLAIQSSSYGTQIPRIYGSMRVAGSVVWATDLIESEQTSGAKGQPDLSYSYSVSLAVALSSRPVQAIGRIWADGKLLRGAEGDFKVPTVFRFYDGSESQVIDPLIGSIEGIADTPAYRGLALAVFENLELAEFGNRIPFMTFEVVADSAPPAIAAILEDASSGAILSDASETIAGYAAYGRSVSAAVQPLVESFDVPLFDDGTTLRAAASVDPIAIGADELGNSSDSEKASAIQRTQAPVRDVPSTLRLSYYDPERDFQAGEARAAAGPDGNEVQLEFPGVLSADGAKTLAEQILARQWAERDRVTLRLPPARIALEPGSIVEPGLAPTSWIASKCTVEGFVTIVELRPAWRPSAQVAGDSGRIAQNEDIVEGPVTLALIDAPNLFQKEGPTVLIAASSASAGWSVRPLTVTSSGQEVVTQTARRKSFLGSAVSVLVYAEPYLIDAVNAVEVQLVDTGQWLTSCDDDALAEGANLAILGQEIVQFGEVTPLGAGRFRLSRLLRARAGTEWASAGHSTGELFCMLDASSLRPVPLPAWARGAGVMAADRAGSSSTITFGAESLIPLQPCNLSATIEAGGDLTLGWTRRSIGGIAWLDEVDAPLGASREQYRVTISAADSILELTADTPTILVPASELAAFAPGSASIEVRQIGDFAASRPAQITINLP